MKLEEKLTVLRKEKGLSQLQLAEMVHVSRQAVSRWEAGTAVSSTDNLKLLSKLYGVPVDDLLHEDAALPRQEAIKREEGTQPAKRKALRLAAVILAVLAILAAVWMAVGRNGSKEVPMSQLEDSSWAEPDIEEFHVGWE